MERAARQWERKVRQHFDFLLAEGFRFVGVEHSFWATSATYLARDVGLRVADSREFARVELDLLRLRDGAVPAPQIWVTEEPVASVLFDNVLQARAPELAERLPTGDADAQLRCWADRLREVAPDFVRGDLAALDDGERVIRQRVAAHPQQITVWLPADASDEEERARIAEAARTAPPEVVVVARRYCR